MCVCVHVSECACACMRVYMCVCTRMHKSECLHMCVFFIQTFYHTVVCIPQTITHYSKLELAEKKFTLILLL